MENVQNRLKINIFRKTIKKKNIEQQSKLTFIGILKSYTNYDSYRLKRN